jgi:hypothetical protein
VASKNAVIFSEMQSPRKEPQMVREITEWLICGLIGAAIMLVGIAYSPVNDTSTSQGTEISIES